MIDGLTFHESGKMRLVENFDDENRFQLNSTRFPLTSDVYVDQLGNLWKLRCCKR